MVMDLPLRLNLEAERAQACGKGSSHDRSFSEVEANRPLRLIDALSCAPGPRISF